MIIPGIEVERRHSKALQQPLAAARRGIMLHYDDSSRDDWAVEWFSDPRCTNGYTWLVLDDGRVVELADPAFRTPHAGACRTPKANSVFYGIAAATDGLTLATDAQLESIAALCASVAQLHGWSVRSIGGRIVGHDQEAIWTPDSTADRARWGSLGRKVDPTGVRPDHHPVVDRFRVISSLQRILPVEPRKAREVGIGRTELTSVLDGQRGEVGVGREVAGDA